MIALNTSAGVDTGDMDEAGIADLFGKTTGFKASEPNVVCPVENDAALDDDDF